MHVLKKWVLTFSTTHCLCLFMLVQPCGINGCWKRWCSGGREWLLLRASQRNGTASPVGHQFITVYGWKMLSNTSSVYTVVLFSDLFI